MTFFFYLKNPCLFSIYSLRASPQEVLTLINTLQQNKASGHDDILPYFLKLTGDRLIYCFAYLINFKLLPDIWHISKKFAKVIPIFKKGSTDLLTNYRLISLLPIFFTK